MDESTRTGCRNIIDALTKHKEASRHIEVGMTWLKTTDQYKELESIQREMDVMTARLAFVISKIP